MIQFESIDSPLNINLCSFSTLLSHDPLSVSVGFSIIGGLITCKLVPEFKESFIKAKLTGKDLAKDDKEPPIPECMGVICATVYLVCMFFFIPFPFMEWFSGKGKISQSEEFHAPTFPHHKLGEFLAAMLSLQSMTFLGFADDIFDISGTDTSALYIWTNYRFRFFILSINDFLFLNDADPAVEAHLFSLYFILPFIGVSFGLIIYNWYPSEVFVGDTYCYFAGMTFAVVGILSHFSKTVLLFFIPQIFNFIYSCPQLFRLIDCPRHRLPRFNPSENKLEYSRVKIQKPLKKPASFVLDLFELLRLVKVDKGETSIEVNNFTLMNLLLLKIGPLHERTLAILVVVIQILASCLSFYIRYHLVHFFYEVI
ncbi:unnamed protein product [Rhizophagus irregularis]|nr:unnamed protein product [Rhizophagus irregularis]